MVTLLLLLILPLSVQAHGSFGHDKPKVDDVCNLPALLAHVRWFHSSRRNSEDFRAKRQELLRLLEGCERAMAPPPVARKERVK